MCKLPSRYLIKSLKTFADNVESSDESCNDRNGQYTVCMPLTSFSRILTEITYYNYDRIMQQIHLKVCLCH